ncbi:MAG: 2-oxoisovalerate dehydrogenase [Dehalococcoidia bacterium]|nr:2-oxoisovalerate dehydrogenase [Dehalococcoidia bacterium]
MNMKRQAMSDSEVIFAVEESPEGGYEARALGYPIFTQADDLQELKAMVQDAARCHFDDDARPQVIRLHFVKDEVLFA